MDDHTEVDDTNVDLNEVEALLAAIRPHLESHGISVNLPVCDHHPYCPPTCPASLESLIRFCLLDVYDLRDDIAAFWASNNGTVQSHGVYGFTDAARMARDRVTALCDQATETGASSVRLARRMELGNLNSRNPDWRFSWVDSLIHATAVAGMLPLMQQKALRDARVMEAGINGVASEEDMEAGINEVASGEAMEARTHVRYWSSFESEVRRVAEHMRNLLDDEGAEWELARRFMPDH